MWKKKKDVAKIHVNTEENIDSVDMLTDTTIDTIDSGYAMSSSQLKKDHVMEVD